MFHADRRADAGPVAGSPSVAPESPRLPEVASGYRTGMTTAYAEQHMAAAANPLAAEAGRRILRQGGSAIDAAIAMQAVLTLVEPQASGIGGGAFLLYWDGKRVQAYDGWETAPAGADENLFLRPDGTSMGLSEARIGGRAVGVPGVLRALELAHRRHGKLPWTRLLQPAIELAEQGFPVSPRLYTQIAADPFIAGSPEMAAYFLTPQGKPKPVGTIVRNPQLAQTLREIARHGPGAFYAGPIAADIVKRVSGGANPGTLSLADLRGYRAKERDPICADYQRWKVCGMPRRRRAASPSRRCWARCRPWRRAIRSTRWPRWHRARPPAPPASNPASTPCTWCPKPGARPMRIAAFTWPMRISCRSTSRA